MAFWLSLAEVLIHQATYYTYTCWRPSQVCTTLLTQSASTSQCLTMSWTRECTWAAPSSSLLPPSAATRLMASWGPIQAVASPHCIWAMHESTFSYGHAAVFLQTLDGVCECQVVSVLAWQCFEYGR